MFLYIPWNFPQILMTPANSTSYIFSFSICISFFPCLLLAKILIICWLRVLRKKFTYFIPDLKRNDFSFPPLSVLLAVGFCTYSLLSWEISLLFLVCRFYHKCVLDFVKSFSNINWHDRIILLHHLLRFKVGKNSSHEIPWDQWCIYEIFLVISK